MAETPNGETPNPEAPSNGTGIVAAPPVDNSNADVEAAKKEAAQAKMRANQVENENKALVEKLAAIERKTLEENQEYKTLAERNQAELDQLKSENAQRERQTELSKATKDVFKDYPDNVVSLAKTAGLSLTDDSDEAVTSLKEKLDTFKSTVGGGSTPKPSNPRQTTPAQASHQEIMAKIRGGDKNATLEYIRELPAVKRMKEMAQNGA